MKKALLLSTVAAALALGAQNAQAQRFGAQVNYADDFDFGVGGRVELPLGAAISPTGFFAGAFVIGSFDYYFPDCDECEYWEINANLAVPLTPGVLRPYVGAGLNYAKFSVDFESPGLEGSASDSEIGLNLLGGLRFALAGLNAFSEAKIELGGGEQFVLTLGVLFGR